MKTIDEQLEEALARITKFESDATASTSLLTEAGHQHERYRQEIVALTKDKETLTLASGELTEQRDQLSRDLATAKQSLSSAATAAEELTKAKDQITALNTEVETLKANAKSAERIAAERYGAASPEPLPVTPRGDAQAATLVEKFKAITDPKEQTAVWRSLTAEQRTLILNAK
jgi:chromosome segregation ATPase